MGAAFRWLLLFFAALVLTAIFEQPLVDMFARWGWQAATERLASDLVNWMASIVGEVAFPWVAAGVLGSAAGAWGHFLAQRFDRKRPKRPNKSAAFYGLAWQIAETADALGHQSSYWSSLPYYSEQRGRWSPDVYGRYLSLEINLGKLGVLIPPSGFIIDSRNHEERVNAVVALLRVLHRLSLGSHLAEAQTQSALHTRSIEAKFTDAEAVEALEQERGSEFPPR